MTIKLLPIKGRNNQNNDKTSIFSKFKGVFPNKIPVILYYVLLVIVVVILITFFLRMLTASDPVSYRNLGMYKAESEMQTGDLVYVSYNNLLGYFMRGITGSVWTHVGMIMRDEEDLYVLETAEYNSIDPKKSKNFKSKGILVVPWDTWKSLNKNHNIAYMQFSTPEDWNRSNLVKQFLEIQKKKLDDFSVGPSVWWKVLKRQKFSSKNINEKRNITCFELIVRLYQESGAAKKIYTPGSYNTGRLIEKKLELNEGFKFKKPLRLM